MESNEEVVRIPPGKNRGGVWIVLGLEEYRIPPLGFGAIQDIQDRLGILNGMSGPPSKEQMGVMVEIVHLSMKRNYPDITLEDVSDMIDLGNYTAVLEAVLSTSGFGRASLGEGQATSKLTGAESTPA